MPIVHLLRHARPRPPSDVDGSNPALSDEGLLAAAALVEPLRNLDIRRIVSSPLRRAQQTVEPVALDASLPIEIDDRLCERRMAVAATPEEHIERVRASFVDPDFAPPGDETFAQTERRAFQCLQERLRETPRGLLLVGHGQCLTLMLRAVGAPVSFSSWQALPVPALIQLSLNERLADGRFHLIWRDRR